MITKSTAARAVTAAAMTAGLALGGAALPSAAHADSRDVAFSFKYRLTTRSWDQRAGTVTFTLRDCNPGGTFHIELKRDRRFARDTRVGGATIRCARGQRVSITAPVSGTYYFVFTKVDDGRHLTGTGTIAYPR